MKSAFRKLLFTCSDAFSTGWRVSDAYLMKLRNSVFSSFLWSYLKLSNHTRSHQESWSHGRRWAVQIEGALAEVWKRVMPEHWMPCWVCSVGWCRERLPCILAQNTGKISDAKPQHHAWSWNHERTKPRITHLLGECYTSQHCSLPSTVRRANSQSIFLEHTCPFKLSPVVTVQNWNLNSPKPIIPVPFSFQLGVFHLKVVMGK